MKLRLLGIAVFAAVPFIFSNISYSAETVEKVLQGEQIIPPNESTVPQITDDVPLGQSAEGEVSLLPEDVAQVDDEENIFGLEGGYFHPYISLTMEYTDNLYNTDEDEVDNILTTISPGIWFALPRKKQIPVTINPTNSSPGGLTVQFDDFVGTDRFQLYLLGGLDYKFYSENDDLDALTGILEGMARWNMRGGLSLQAVDRYTRGEDKLEIGAVQRDFERQYDSNFFMATADWTFTEKFRVQGDYVNFFLQYEDDVNENLDRVDNGFNLKGYYLYSLKTSFFLEYRYLDIAYDVNTDFDSNIQFLYGGIKWDTTEKFAMVTKLGWQRREFEDHSLGQEDTDSFAVDVQMTYRWTIKTILELDLFYANQESDYYLAGDKTVLGAEFRYTQSFTDKWKGSLKARYEDSQYNYLATVSDEDDRHDVSIQFRPAIQFLAKEWLMFELSYLFNYRDSNDDTFDFLSNSIAISANLAL